MNIPGNKTLNLVISPHLDDAVFSLGGFIHNNSKNTKIVTIFAGTPKNNLIRGWDLRIGFWGSTKAMKERIKENKLSLKNLGLTEQSIINLKFLDKQYRKSKKINSELKEAIYNEVIKIINIKNFEQINIFIPITKAHLDHQIVRDAFLEKFELLKNKNIDLFLYQDLPYFYKNIKKMNKPKIPILKNFNYEIEKIELTNKSFLKKVESSKLYKSQFVIFSTIYKLFKKQLFISNKQKDLLEIQSPYCEIVYKIN